MVIAWVVLSALNGPTEDGFRCHRAPGQSGQCEILRSRFFGLAGNSSYPVSEDLIHTASARCGHAQVGRASSSCNVYLVLQSGANELVLSFALPAQAEDAARRANLYIADHSRTALEIRESVLTTVILRLAAPVLLVALLLWLRRRHARPDKMLPSDR